MAKRNIIVMGGSTGSFEVFKTIANGLPADLNASIFIVWHMSADIRGVLPAVLNRVGPLEAIEPRDGDLIETGKIYVARPDHHLLIDDSHIRITRGPKENRFRPAIDPLFRSAAYNYGPRVIGIITSGALDDGTSGIWTIKQRGGLTIAQDPADAEISSIPESAIQQVKIDHIVPASKMADLITRLVKEEVDETSGAFMQSQAENEKTKEEIRVAAEENSLPSGTFDLNELTPFTCPECSGVLARIKDGERVRFRC
ncbi:MAG TPA: chemotaxis protein CheB, partial [Pyrinomonadaceae bacterium]